MALLSHYRNTNCYNSEKSALGKQFSLDCEENIKPSLENRDDIADMMATFVEHIAIHISASVKTMSSSIMLITGGGAKNKYLIERIQANTKHKVFVPSEDIIDYKEALVFAFLGLLRSRDEINVLKSVTGAESDSSSGKIYKTQ